MLDQAFVSALNFLIIFLLSKRADTDVFSSFVLVQASGLLLVTLSQAFASQPLLALNEQYLNRGMGNSYKSSVLLLNALLILPTAFFVGSLLVIAYGLSIKAASAFVFYVLSWTTFELARRIQYVDRRPHVSAFASFALLCVVIGLTWSYHSSVLEIAITLGCSYLAISLYELGGYISVVPSLISKGRGPFFIDRMRLGSLVTQHWHYGKWVAPGAAAFWVTSQAYLLLASAYLGPTDVSDLRTSQNVAGVLTIVMVALENFLTPRYAQTMETEGTSGLDDLVRRHQSRIVGVSLAAIGVGAPLIYAVSSILYPEFKAEVHVLTSGFFIGYALQLINRPYVCALRSTRITRPFATAQGLAAVAALVLGIVALPTLGTVGGPLVFTVAALVFFYIIRYYYFRNIRHRSKRQ
jgi:hypothetical protein